MRSYCICLNLFDLSIKQVQTWVEVSPVSKLVPNRWHSSAADTWSWMPKWRFIQHRWKHWWWMLKKILFKTYIWLIENNTSNPERNIHNLDPKLLLLLSLSRLVLYAFKVLNVWTNLFWEKNKHDTPWSKETVTCNISLAEPKKIKTAQTQWFLETLYWVVLVFWYPRCLRCKLFFRFRVVT